MITSQSRSYFGIHGVHLFEGHRLFVLLHRPKRDDVYIFSVPDQYGERGSVSSYIHIALVG